MVPAFALATRFPCMSSNVDTFVRTSTITMPSMNVFALRCFPPPPALRFAYNATKHFVVSPFETDVDVDVDADADADAHPTFYDDLDALVERFPGGDAASGEKLALVFGNEADGLSVEQLKMCDAVCSIPMGRLVESLSVTHAGVITLSRYFERRGARIDRR